MIRKFVVLVLLMFLAACSREQPVAPLEAEAPAAAAASVDTAPVPQGFVYSPLPEGVSIATPFHVRNDRIYSTRTGAMRRRSNLELLEGDAAAAAVAVGSQLQAGGFRSIEIEDKGDGMTRLAFIKKAAGRVNLRAGSDVGAKPANPLAQGLLSIDWQVSAAPAAGSDDAAESVEGSGAGATEG